MEETSHWRWRPKTFLALAVIISLVPLPVLAGEGSQPGSATPSLRASAARVVAREVLKSANDGLRAARSSVPEVKSAASFNDRVGVTRHSEQGTTPGSRSGQFFKTGAGIAVMAVFAVGVGYALYSAQHDRIHSAGKQ